MRHLLTAALMLAVSAAPAAASALPRVDFKQGELAVAAGVVDANLDYALTDRLSMGVFYALPWSVVTWGARVTYRAWESPWLALGVTLSGGQAQPGLVNVAPGDSYASANWGQLALNAAVPLGSWPLTLRATVGPTYAAGNRLLDGLHLNPNAELAWRFHPNHELTVGGNALIGWRGTFGLLGR